MIYSKNSSIKIIVFPFSGLNENYQWQREKKESMGGGNFVIILLIS